MFADLSKSSHVPVAPVYSSTVPHGLNLRFAPPVNRMTITGAPSGVAPVPVAHPVVTRTSPDPFLAATRASYQENPRQVCSMLRVAKKSVAIPGVARRQMLPAAREKGQAARAEGGACAPLRAGSMEKCCDGTARNPRVVQSRGARGRACVNSPHSPRHLSRPWTPSSVSISTLSAASRRWGKGGCRFGRQDTVGRTWPSNAPRCFWGRSGGSESALCRCVREVEGCARPRGMRQRRRKDTADCEACLVVCWRC